MKFEHFALNVPDARAHARWLVAQLGFTVARNFDVPPYMHFLADETGRLIVELYSSPAATIPDYQTQHPLVFHLALVSADTVADRARLEQAGATFFAEDTLPDGSRLLMMRDPWGLPLQFCQRAKPFPMP
ncbi:MAG: VOC family protein [Opitutus sp.]|nr:VOC family protein [Opitutus sp.]